MAVLEQFNYNDLNEFQRDFLLVMKMMFEIDKEYGSIDQSFLHNLPEYEECLKLFSKKYKDIILKPDTSPSTKNLDIFFDEKSVRNVFEVARKIKRVRAVGKGGMGLVPVTNTTRFEQMLQTISDKIYIAYYTVAKSKTIILKFNKDEKKPELIYDEQGIVDEKSPEFKLCAYYGCLNGFDKKINLRNVAKTFFKPGRGVPTPTRFWR